MAKKPMLCGIVDKVFGVIANFFSYIDNGSCITITDVDEYSATISYGENLKLYGVNLEFGSNRLKRAADSIENLLKRLKTEEDGKLLINFTKNSYEYFVHIYSSNRNTIDSIANSFEVKLMSGKEIAKSIGAYFLFNSYDIKNNVLIDYFTPFIEDNIENMQFHRVSNMLATNALKNNDIYQAIAYKEREFNAIRLFSIDGWEGTLSLFLDFSDASVKYKFNEIKEKGNRVDAEMGKLLRDIEDDGMDVLVQDYGLVNCILLSNSKKYVAQIESITGMLFEENWLSGPSSFKRTMLNKRDSLFDIFISSKNAKQFFQSCKKRVEKEEKRGDGSWIYPDFYGKDIAQSFINYSFGQNANPHAIITAKTGSGKSSALLKILKSSGRFGDDYKSSFFEEGEIKFRYCDIDYSGGKFVEKIRSNYGKEMVHVYGSDAAEMKFCLLDIDTEGDGPNAKPVESEVKNVCSFVNIILEATDPDSVLDNSEEDRLKDAIYKVFSDERYRVDKTIAEISKEEGYERLTSQILKKYRPETRVSELGDEYSFFKKPTLINVIDYVEKMSLSNNISEIQKDVYKTLLKKISGLQMFNFARYANVDISNDNPFFYVDLGEIKSSQKEFVALGWMLLRSWFKLDRETYIKRTAKGLPRQKIFYILEESHNFFTIPSFKELFQAAVKEYRKFGVHFLFISHTVEDMPKDVYKSIATKIFLFTEGDADEVRREISNKTDMEGQRLEVFQEAKKNKYAMYIMHDAGEDVCTLNMTKQDLETFLPYKIKP